MPDENTTIKHPTPTASNTDREPKSYQCKVRMSDLTELDSKFFIDRQLRDNKKVKVIQNLNSSGNVIETQRLGKYDKDKSRTRNLWICLGCPKSNHKSQ